MNAFTLRAEVAKPALRTDDVPFDEVNRKGALDSAHAFDLRFADMYFRETDQFHEVFNKAELTALDRMSMLVDTRDDVTGIHALRVGRLARLFALHLGFPARAADAIELGARLHDIGKPLIPDRIVLKPGPLDADERRTMEQHVILGGRLLGNSRLPSLVLARVIARHHHEHWDGQGYPYGLSGTQIPLIVRLVSIVDVFDALINERPYKRAWAASQALAWLAFKSGKQFDPNLVVPFIQFIQRQLYRFDAFVNELSEPPPHASLLATPLAAAA